MTRPDLEQLQERVEVDEALVGGDRPGKSGRGANGKMVVGAVEAEPGRGRKRPLGRLRLQAILDASAASLAGFIAADTEQPLTVTTDGWAGYRGLGSKGYAHEAIHLSASLRGLLAAPASQIGSMASWPSMGRRQPAPAGDPPRLQPRQALALGHPSRRGKAKAPATLPRRIRLPLQPQESKGHQPRLRPPDLARRQNPAHHLSRHRAWGGCLRVAER